MAEHVAAQAGKRGKAKPYTARRVVVGVRDGAEGERGIPGRVAEIHDLPIDRIATALQQACPDNARARLDYDGKKLQADVEFFSDVKPENAVVGETWKAVARISTDDTGGGSIRGDGGIFIALSAISPIRHLGRAFLRCVTSEISIAWSPNFVRVSRMCSRRSTLSSSSGLQPARTT